MNLRTPFVAVACLLLSPILSAQSTPLSREEILGRLAYKPSPSFIAHLVKTRGIDFSIRESFLSQVRLAGGDGILVERLLSPDAGIGGTPSEQEENPLEHLARCAELVHKGANEQAEEECRAAIEENSKSPWPLLITAELVRQNAPDMTDPSDSYDEEEEEATQQKYNDLESRAAPLDPRGEARSGEGNEGVNPQSFSDSSGLRVPPEVQADTDPELGSAHRLLAYRYFAVGDFENAQRELQRAARLEPDYPVNHTCLAYLYSSTGNKEEAIAEFRETVRIVPFGAKERKILSSTLEDMGRTSEAIQELKDLLAVSPGDVEASDKLVNLYLKHKDRKSAIAELQRSLKESSLKFNDDDRLIQVRYDDLERLGDLFLEERKVESAAGQYLFLLRHRPEDADLHNDYGNVLMDQNRLDEAIEEYNVALRFDPKMAVAHQNIGLCLSLKKDFDGAIAEFRRALDLNPKQVYTQIQLGIALAQKGDLKAAEEQCLNIHPKDSEGHASLGHALYLLKNTSGAIQQLRLALELDPDSVEAQNNLAWIYATADNLKLRNPAAALVLARKAVKATGGQIPSFLDTLAEALLLNGRSSEALLTEQQAVSLDPNNPKWESRLAHFQAAVRLASASKQ